MCRQIGWCYPISSREPEIAVLLHLPGPGSGSPGREVVKSRVAACLVAPRSHAATAILRKIM